MGRDFWVASDGALTGNYQIGRDLIAMYARNGIAGEVHAKHDIELVVSNAGINAHFTAGYTPGPDDPADGAGSIKSVHAWDDIAGEMTATVSIDEIVAGGEVTATLDAPSIGTITEHDRSEFKYWDQPHQLEFDWLKAMASDVAHGDTLLREAIGASVTAEHNAVTAARADAAKDLADTIEFLSIARTAATAGASALATQLSTAASEAVDSADYVAKGISTGIKNALADMAASEDRMEKVVGYQMVLIAASQAAELLVATAEKEKVLASAGQIEVLANTVQGQIVQKITAEMRRAAEIDADLTSRSIDIGIYDVGTREHLGYSNWFTHAIGDSIMNAVGVEALAYAEPWQVGVGVGIASVGMGLGIFFTPALAGALGGGFTGVVGAGALIGGAEYVGIWTGISAISNGTVGGPTLGGTLVAMEDGAVFGGAFHVIGRIAKPLIGGLKGLAGFGDDAGRGVANAGGYGFWGRNVPPPTGPASPALRELFISNAESTMFRTRINIFNKMFGRSPVDWDQFMSRLRSSDFNEYSSFWKESRKSLGYADAGANGWQFGLSKLLRSVPGVRNSAARHELFHAVDDLTTGLFSNPRTLGLWFRAEAGAHVFGGPLVGLVGIPGLASGAVYVGWWISKLGGHEQ